MKTCTKCGTSKEENDFPMNGKYRRNECAVCRKAFLKAYKARPEQREKARAFAREWHSTNAEKKRADSLTWARNNKAKANMKTARRKASLMRATPKWSDESKVKEFYFAADFLGMVTGEWYHVDHVVPLSNKLVCGLHSEQNLQVLPASDNLRKSNRRWPDMP